MFTERRLNLVLILDTKLPEIENILSLATEIGFVVFKASNNISKFFLLLFIASNTQNSAFSGMNVSNTTDVNGILRGVWSHIQ
jgi:hypothetical protein